MKSIIIEKEDSEDARRNSRMFVTRLISSIVLVILMVGGIFAGNTVFAILFAVISLIGMMELYRIYGINRALPGMCGYMIAIVYDLLAYMGYVNYLEVVLVFGAICLLSIYVICFPKYNTNQVMAAFFAVIYVAVTLSYVFRIRMMEDGFVLVWLVFICSWINDTCAYLVGVLIGKHKMTPKLSPKKSVEGAIGGIIGTAIIAALYGHIFAGNLRSLAHPSLMCAAACAFGAILSIFGDLAASAVKRDHNIKDYGRLIPGHGGILDRFDSMIFTAPVIFWIITLLSKI